MMNLSVLTVIFAGGPELASFIGAIDDGGGGDNWRYKSCKILRSNRHHQHPT